MKENALRGKRGLFRYLHKSSEEERRYHNLEELVTRTENLHDSRSKLNRFMIFDNLLADGFINPIKDASRLGIFPLIYVLQANVTPEWIVGLGIFGSALGAIAPFATRSQFPYTMNPIKRIRALRQTQKFVGNYLDCNDDHVPVVPEDAVLRLEDKMPLLSRIEETKRKGRYSQTLSRSDIHDWIADEYASFKETVATKEYPRMVLSDLKKFERISVPEETKYDERSIYEWAKDGVLGVVDKIMQRPKKPKNMESD